MSSPASPPPFRLLRRFALVAAVVIGAIAVINGTLMSRLLNQQLFQREGSLTRDFVMNILESDGSIGYLSGDAALTQRFQGSMVHLANLRDVLRANVYSRERRVLWSTDAQLIDRVLPDNDELDEALAGELVVHAGHVEDDDQAGKAEYAGLSRAARYFVETYVPVRTADGRVVGVVELYKVPVALSEAIHAGRRWAIGSALLGALLLFGSLTWLVARADATLRTQQAQLLQAETLAAVGQLAAVVAHNVRNPLASIRSSAELALEAPAELARASAADILHDADRISARINELLRLAAPVEASQERVDLAALVSDCAREQQPQYARRQQRLLTELPEGPAEIEGDATLLRHALTSLLANASEAMPADAECRLRLLAAGERRWALEVVDAGSGLAPAAMQALERPFVTTKPQGLGLGLLLARRIVERLGGTLSLKPNHPQGTVARIELPRA